jgi:hypothetical protein
MNIFLITLKLKFKIDSFLLQTIASPFTPNFGNAFETVLKGEGCVPAKNINKILEIMDWNHFCHCICQISRELRGLQLVRHHTDQQTIIADIGYSRENNPFNLSTSSSFSISNPALFGIVIIFLMIAMILSLGKSTKPAVNPVSKPHQRHPPGTGFDGNDLIG